MDIETIKLSILGDVRGQLISLEANKNIPFNIKRVYYIFGTMPNVPRGFHAHKNLNQVLIAVKGQCTLLLDDGTEKKELILNSPDLGVVIPPLAWHVMSQFSPDCILMCLADDYYDESDYMRDYDEFIEYIRS